MKRFKNVIFAVSVLVGLSHQVYSKEDVDKKKSMSNVKKIAKKKATTKGDKVKQVKEVVDIIKVALGHLVGDARYMAVSEAISRELRDLAIKIYKGEAYFVLGLVHMNADLLMVDLDANPFANEDVYFDGIFKFDQARSIAFETLGSSKTQRDKLMFALRSSIHENIFSIIDCINDYTQTFLIDDFKYGGHKYVDSAPIQAIELYKQLSQKEESALDKQYQCWQVVFYKGLIFILKSVALSVANQMKQQGNEDAFRDLMDLANTLPVTLKDVQNAIPKKK
jgi:hypothetical protein